MRTPIGRLSNHTLDDWFVIAYDEDGNAFVIDTFDWPEWDLQNWPRLSQYTSNTDYDKAEVEWIAARTPAIIAHAISMPDSVYTYLPIL